MEKFKAIIFDMDGVLFDTETFYYRRREKFLADKGISIKHLPPSFLKWSKDFLKRGTV